METAIPTVQVGVRPAHRAKRKTKWPVTVIIRSAGDPNRASALKRAVQSALSQEAVDVACSVVFNGRGCDKELIRWTRSQPMTSAIIVHDGTKSEATLIGRQFVETPYFAYLDDDDELLPYALAGRIAILEREQADCVATNGYYCRTGADEPLFTNTQRFLAGEFLESLLESRNWLASGACMFRTQTVTEHYFQDLPRHREWTVIAYRIASGARVKFCDVPTCRINSSSKSESKKDSYVEAAAEAWEKIMQVNRRDDLLPAIRRQQCVALRNLCSYYRLQRRFGSAWGAYVRALNRGAGWSFVPYAALLLMRTTRPAQEIARMLRGRLDRYAGG